MGKVTMVLLTLVLCFSSLITVKAQSCGTRDDCLRSDVGYNCVSGRCGCADANADCPAGDVCDKAKCVECSVRGDCASNNKGKGCYDAKCGCKGDADCGGNEEVCKDGRCKSLNPSSGEPVNPGPGAMCPPVC